MTIDTKKIYSTISQFQGEMTQAHFELVSTYLYEGQNSKLRDLDCNLILTYLIYYKNLFQPLYFLKQYLKFY